MWWRENGDVDDVPRMLWQWRSQGNVDVCHVYGDCGGGDAVCYGGHDGCGQWRWEEAVPL